MNLNVHVMLLWAIVSFMISIQMWNTSTIIAQQKEESVMSEMAMVASVICGLSGLGCFIVALVEWWK
jgi:hypothetical protein